MSNYPTSLDTDAELHLVHDSLRVKLAEDYNPGDVSLTVDDTAALAKFPPTGIITLTEQCNFDVTLRAISFTYTGKSSTGFVGLELLPEFTDVAKPKRLTNVTMNVVADHHNSLKDALINIEEFAGKRGDISTTPLTGSMEARINYLRKLVLKPKAWLTVNSRVGIVPFTISIKDLSLRAPTQYVYDFGDSTTQTLNFAFVPGQAEGTADVAPTPGDVTKTYTVPGVYDLTLTVTNPYGTDTIVLPNYIQARTLAPDEATIEFDPSPTQQLIGGVLKTKANVPVDMAVLDNGEQSSDPIVSYSWSMSDDVPHSSGSHAEGLWSLGGLYDIKLRANSTFGSFRITTFPQVVDVVENTNVWMGIFDPSAMSTAVTKNLQMHEFGLLCETFKTRTATSLSVSRNSAFLTGQPSEDQQKREFRRNNGFTPRSLVTSGDQGASILYWSEGAADYSSSQVIRFAEYSGFTDTFSAPNISGTSNYLTRSWNWLSLNSPSSIYFMFGTRPGSPTDITDTDLQIVDLSTLTVGGQTLRPEMFQNGAGELTSNVGDGIDGEFSVYRTCWRNSTGFIARNDGTGQYFRIKSFYRTEGVLGDPMRVIRKLPDVPGDTKHEGQLVSLSNGVYFFNNTGEVAVYNPTTNVWSTGGPGVGSPAFSSLQDSSVVNFDSPANSLIANGDGNHNAYLSFDYTNSSFLKFSEIDLTFSKLPDRPSGEQFNMTVY
jgi:PKD repeat protein